MTKLREYECPKCANFETVHNVGTDFEIDLAETDEGEEYEYISVMRHCPVCGHYWTEYLRLTYDGYSSEGFGYGANGEKIRD